MNRKLFILLFIVVTTISCTETKKNVFKADIISTDLKYCEGSLVDDSFLLVSNFGADEFNPLNDERKGYIVKIDGNNSEILIPADGNLSGPKGMAINNNYLYIADVGKVVVYDLSRNNAPQVINMPEGNLFVNDIVISDNQAYISVTNTGKIYKMDISTPEELNDSHLTEYIDVVGANGLLLDGKTMYIASYPADGNTTAENVIYVIEDIDNPQLEKFITREGQYDGLALYDSKLYFTNWVNNEIGYVDMKTKSVELLNIEGATLTGPADISIMNDKLYIPNLPASEIVVVSLK